jgi:hypothetical protein
MTSKGLRSPWSTPATSEVRHMPLSHVRPCTYHNKLISNLKVLLLEINNIRIENILEKVKAFYKKVLRYLNTDNNLK